MNHPSFLVTFAHEDFHQRVFNFDMSNEHNDYQEAIVMFDWLMKSYKKLYQKQCNGYMLDDKEIDRMEILFLTSYDIAQFLLAGRNINSLNDREAWSVMEDIQLELVSDSKIRKQRAIIMLVLIKCYDYLEKLQSIIINK